MHSFEWERQWTQAGGSESAIASQLGRDGVSTSAQHLDLTQDRTHRSLRARQLSHARTVFTRPPLALTPAAAVLFFGIFLGGVASSSGPGVTLAEVLGNAAGV